MSGNRKGIHETVDNVSYTPSPNWINDFGNMQGVWAHEMTKTERKGFSRPLIFFFPPLNQDYFVWTERMQSREQQHSGAGRSVVFSPSIIIFIITLERDGRMREEAKNVGNHDIQEAASPA